MIQTKIGLSNFRIFSFHGYYPEEKIIGQWFELNAEVVLAKNPENENLSDSFDYVELVKIIEMEMAIPRDLLETILESIIQKILNKNLDILSIEISITKPNLVLKGIKVDSKVTKTYLKSP